MAGMHYDVGIVGWWCNLNYGGVISYFALHRAVARLGKTVVMIEKGSNDTKIPQVDSIPRRFAKKYYAIGPNYGCSDMYQYNELCDVFIAGSDQLWSPSLERYAGPECFLSFVDPEKTKIAYAASYGSIERCPADFVSRYKPLIKQFDAVSVREDYAVGISKRDFDMDVVQVCDPIFLCDASELNMLADRSERIYPNKYVLNFLLDPNSAELEIADYIHGIISAADSVNITDLQSVEKNMAAFAGRKVEVDAGIEDLLKAYRDAEYVVTDSYIGICLAALYNKPFVLIANAKRGIPCYVSMLNMLGLHERMVYTIDEVKEKKALFKSIDYRKVNKIIQNRRDEGIRWLKKAIETGKTQIAREAGIAYQNQKIFVDFRNNPDFKKIRMLATLLRDYGIRHIVLSPGGRDVPLIRMFENNESHFILHRVTDERSAGYFGLGLAAQLKQPVACVCTSGTAASNYLPAVTEAYYTGIPLIMITADRCDIYHEHGEDQCIPQKYIYRDVVKKEITIPEGGGFRPEYQTRRDISDCILESTHDGWGPVHINIAVDNIGIGVNVPKTEWHLLPKINPHILRVSPCDGEAKMMEWVNALKKSKRILLVYGQNPKPSEKQRKNIEAFASKFNCVIVTDLISNLDCTYSLKTFNMLQSVSLDEFNATFAPDILISVGGKQLMNDPLAMKVRASNKGIRHWSVRPDGKISDFYFKLSSVLEMSQDYFFEWFASHAGNISNNGEYYKTWQMRCEQAKAPAVGDYFNAFYIQSKFLPAIPKNSILHLGVGQSFFFCRRYGVNPDVEVFCNMGTNGIDGCTSTFMGQCAVAGDKKCFLLVGDLSFFYDMNSIWNKRLHHNIRILLVNNNGSGLLRGHNLKAVTSVHNTAAEGWVKSTGFEYISARTKEEFEEKLKYFLSDEPKKAVFFEVFCL